MKLHLAKPGLTVSRKFYLLLAGNLVVLTLIGFFVLRPVFGSLAKHTTEITRTRADIAALEQKTAALRQLKETYPTYEATYGPLVQSAPKTKDVGGYQTELEELAALTGITLKTVDTSGNDPAQGQTGTSTGQAKQVSVGGFPAFPVRMTLIGSYASLLDFVSRIETMDRFSRVTGLKLQRADGAGTVNATLDVETLYFGT